MQKKSLTFEMKTFFWRSLCFWEENRNIKFIFRVKAFFLGITVFVTKIEKTKQI